MTTPGHETTYPYRIPYKNTFAMPVSTRARNYSVFPPIGTYAGDTPSDDNEDLEDLLQPEEEEAPSKSNPCMWLFFIIPMIILGGLIVVIVFGALGGKVAHACANPWLHQEIQIACGLPDARQLSCVDETIVGPNPAIRDMDCEFSLSAMTRSLPWPGLNFDIDLRGTQDLRDLISYVSPLKGVTNDQIPVWATRWRPPHESKPIPFSLRGGKLIPRLTQEDLNSCGSLCDGVKNFTWTMERTEAYVGPILLWGERDRLIDGIGFSREVLHPRQKLDPYLQYRCMKGQPFLTLQSFGMTKRDEFIVIPVFNDESEFSKLFAEEVEQCRGRGVPEGEFCFAIWWVGHLAEGEEKPWPEHGRDLQIRVDILPVADQPAFKDILSRMPRDEL